MTLPFLCAERSSIRSGSCRTSREREVNVPVHESPMPVDLAVLTPPEAGDSLRPEIQGGDAPGQQLGDVECAGLRVAQHRRRSRQAVGEHRGRASR